jgi:hypothetical protein
LLLTESSNAPLPQNEVTLDLDFTDQTYAAFTASSVNDFLITESSDYIEVTPLTVQGADPQVMLRWSDDGGHTWSNEHWRSIGRIGEYGQRAIWRRLGMTMKLRDRVYELSGTDSVKMVIIDAELMLSGTNA